jgi:lipopolysaccharide/colanic/teichoic acid biosynthesis glycosyltransferase
LDPVEYRRWRTFVVKRSMDIALAGLFLVLSLPLLAAAAIAIKLSSEGPVFFFQMRVGRGLMLFRIFKLRTMRVDGQGPSFTLSQDSRVTGVGRWLRRFKVDELPQLWNVLCGDMSLVGPRPVVPDLIEGFEQAYVRLLCVRPGLTDPATIKYFREDECLSRVADQHLYYKTVLIPDKLRLSAAYLERANVFTDLAIVAQTAMVLIPDICRPGPVAAWFAEKTKLAWLLSRRDVPTAKGTAVAEEV